MEYTPRRKLTREFKLEAVRQAAVSEKPKAQLARELGVRVGQLRTWRLEFEKEAVTGSIVTMRIRTWRPTMPSISGPRSTVASNFTVIPFVSGATCPLLILLSCLSLHDLTYLSIYGPRRRTTDRWWRRPLSQRRRWYETPTAETQPI